MTRPLPDTPRPTRPERPWHQRRPWADRFTRAWRDALPRWQTSRVTWALIAALAGSSQAADADGAVGQSGPAGKAIQDTAANPTSAPPRIEIDAPSDLRALLTSHLDLARLARLRDDESLDDTEWRRLSAAAPAQARELLQTEGYFESQISVVREPGPPVRVRLTVVPGPRVLVTALKVRAGGALGEQIGAVQDGALRLDRTLQAAGPLQVGQPFRNPLWSETKLQWLTLLRSAGYAAARLDSSAAEVDVANAAARLEGVVDSGPLFRAGALQIEGLSRSPMKR